MVKCTYRPRRYCPSDCKYCIHGGSDPKCTQYKEYLEQKAGAQVPKTAHKDLKATFDQALKPFESMDHPKPLPRYKCRMCGHEWESRPYRFKHDMDRPFKCPKCGSRYWDGS